MAGDRARHAARFILGKDCRPLNQHASKSWTPCTIVYMCYMQADGITHM
jgi:hypothetical protein